MPTSILSKFAGLLTVFFTVHSSYGEVIFPDGPRTYFDRDIILGTGAEKLIGRPNYPFVGESLTLHIQTEPGDEIIWKFNGEEIPNESRFLLSLSHLDVSHTGNYQCVVTRDGISVASRPVTINVISRPQASLIDNTFTPVVRPGLEAHPIVIDSEGWIAVRAISYSLYERAWWWVSPDGKVTEEIYSVEGSISPEGVVKFFADGSYLFRDQGVFTLRHRNGDFTIIDDSENLLGNRDYILKSLNGNWILGDPTKLIGITPAGTTTFQKNSSNYGVFSIYGLIEIPNANGRFLLRGSVVDTAQTNGVIALLVEPDGDPVAGFNPILFDHIPPTVLPDQTFAHCENGVLRLFDQLGNQTFRVELPELVLADAVAFSPDGWLYATIRGLGLMRFDLQGNRDPDYIVYFPEETTTFTPAIIFDHLNRPLIGIMPENYESLNDASALVRLKNTAPAFGAPPVAVAYPETVLSTSTPWSTTGSAIGSGPITYQWLRLDHDSATELPAGPRLQFPSIQVADLGLYQLRATSPFGSSFGPLVDLRPQLRPRLVNLSGRGIIGEQSELIAGFVIDQWRLPESHPESASERVLLRGVGPTLADFDVSSPATDPVMVLENIQNGLILRNDDWSPVSGLDDLLMRANGVFPLRFNSADAQTIQTLSKGVYVSTVQAKVDSGGVALAEIHAMFQHGEAELSNLSLRGNVGEGEDVLIGGFIVSDPEKFDRPLRMLIRAVGPTLNEYGVAGSCADPKLTLYDAGGNVVATNDNWSNSHSTNIAEIARMLGAFELPADSMDAATIVELPPGAYTGHVTDNKGIGGQALFEIYRIPAGAEDQL